MTTLFSLECMIQTQRSKWKDVQQTLHDLHEQMRKAEEEHTQMIAYTTKLIMMEDQNNKLEEEIARMVMKKCKVKQQTREMVKALEEVKEKVKEKVSKVEEDIRLRCQAMIEEVVGHEEEYAQN